MRDLARGLRAALGVGILVCTSAPSEAQTPELVWVLRGVTVIDPTASAPLADGEIVVRRDRVDCVGPQGSCEVPADAETIDRDGYFVIPGLWNSHAHLTIASTYLFMAERLPPAVAERLRHVVLRIYLASGVTGLVLLIDDPGTVKVLRSAERYGELLAPRLFTCGWGISYPGSWNDLGGAETPTTPEEARAAVRRQAADNVDCIMTTVESGPGPVYTRPRMPADVVRAVVEEAHRLDLPVYAHATHHAEMRDVARGGVDVVANGLQATESVPTQLIEELRAERVYYSPTLVLYDSYFRYLDEPERLDEPFLRSRLTVEMYRALTDSARHARFIHTIEAIGEGAGVDWARADFPHAMAATQAIFDAGVEPLVGTDPMFFVVPGYDVHRELELLVEAGLTPADAIRAATWNAAKSIRRASDFGSIKPGAYADFVVLEADPLNDILNTRKIDFVVKGGQIYVAGMLLRTVGAGG